MIVSDNGSVFTTKEFANFVKQYNITHVKASPYHLSTNGLAECAIQTFKASRKFTEGTPENKLPHFLFHYHLTPRTTAGQFPAEPLSVRYKNHAWTYFNEQ